MVAIKKTQVVNYTVSQMYSLVNAVETYPEFVPWCVSAVVHLKNEQALQATLAFKKGPLKCSFTTANSLKKDQSIIMQYISGPFRYLQGTWQFNELDDKRSKIDFALDYEFQNRILSVTIEPIFHAMMQNMIDAFHERAKTIYATS